MAKTLIESAPSMTDATAMSAVLDQLTSRLEHGSNADDSMILAAIEEARLVLRNLKPADGISSVHKASQREQT